MMRTHQVLQTAYVTASSELSDELGADLTPYNAKLCTVSNVTDIHSTAVLWNKHVAASDLRDLDEHA